VTNLSLHGGLPLRVLLRAIVVEQEVCLSADALHFGCVRAGCCKVPWLCTAQSAAI